MLLPVRHHSPACARYVRAAIEEQRPALVLIEGPADFNDRIGELLLEHRPPIAVYSYVAWDDGTRQGAYYPLCEYSPEWQALLAARAVGAQVRFIDLPFAALAREDRRAHRYADDRLRGGGYAAALCRALEVENFDDAWDVLAEQDPVPGSAEIRQRVANYCRGLRTLDAEQDAVPGYDLRREAFMAAHVRAARREVGADRVLVVTGGYHTSALEQLLVEDGDAAEPQLPWPEGIIERGIALTPYSYERLDSLAGYDAGMPSPGFYHEAWRAAGRGGDVHGPVLAAAVHRLRELKQPVSTADLIAVETSAQALAALRGRARVWRRDLLDAITAALVKDDVAATHPLLQAVHAALRGGERGRLADGSPLPPLVRDIQARLAEEKLTPEKYSRSHVLTLTVSAEAARSRLLHRLRVLRLPGFTRTAGVDFARRADLTALTETWRVQWMPEQDAAMIEASRYGSALDEATAAALTEAARGLERDAARGALLLLDAVLAGVAATAASLRARVAELIHADGSLASVAAAMGHVLHLFAWDDVLGTRGNAETGALLRAAWERAAFLLESGAPAGTPVEEVEAVRLLRDAFERAEEPMALDRSAFGSLLARVQADRERPSAQRGACAGALWSLRQADPADIRRDLRLFAAPERLGDFLTGLFSLAREEAQHDRELLAEIHALVIGWDVDGFLAALPALRLAFMNFTPREKANLADELFAAAPTAFEEPVVLAVSPEEAADAMRWEAALWALAERHGVQLGPPPSPV